MNLSALETYELIKKEELKDIASVGWLLRHKKSGARVMLIENDDDNKVFNIVFRTTPSDSTGVAHITEHTVLCGSEKYPSKDPFVELVKGSMNTFLNAMTYPDKTMYPVASCNDQDFKNLMDVYLDAVLHPNIYKNEQIFRQEGWSFQLENEEDDIVLNGVVYNEMKGAYSSPDDVLERQVMHSLFPDTTYGVDSGGDPDCIPDLSYEDFLNFHRSYYHPSNSYIYLFGKMDFEERLNYLDREYLSKYDYLELDSEVRLQKAFDKPVRMVRSYPVGENDPIENRSYLTFNLVMGESCDTRLAGAMAVLNYVLLEASGAPLKMALLDAGVGADVYGSYDSGIRQPVFSITAKNADSSDEERFIKIIRETIEKLISEGLNTRSIEAAINSMEFKYREADFGGYPKGLFYSMDIFDSWLYDDERPFDYLRQSEDFIFLKNQIGSGYYEDLLRRYFLDNCHASILICEPKRGMTFEAEEKVNERLRKLKDSLSEDEVREMINKTALLRSFQETPSSQEELLKIPVLSRQDLKKEAAPFDNHIMEKDGIFLVHHDYRTNGILYLTLYLDASSVAKEDYPYLGLLRSVLGEVDTENYGYDDLAMEINRRTGGVSCQLAHFRLMDDPLSIKAALTVQISVLEQELDFALDIAGEILFSSRLRSEKRLKEILQKIRSRLYTRLVSAGHSTAAGRAMACFDADARFADATAGVEYYRLVTDLDDHFEEKKEYLADKLEQILEKLLLKDAFFISFTGDRLMADKILDSSRRIYGRLNDGSVLSGTAPEEDLDKSRACGGNNFHALKRIGGFESRIRKEGFLIPSKIQYLALAGSFTKSGRPFTGALDVLKVILDYDYLWTNIRVIGGAYGCGASFGRNGISVFYSYRDPHLKNTIDMIAGIADYVREFDADERDMTKYVIGTISGFDSPLTPKLSGIRSMSALISGMDLDGLQKERDEILSVSAEDIRALLPYIEAILKDEALTVVGSEDKLNSERELFGNLEAL